MSDMVKYRAALWSFLKLTAHVFYHVWHSPCVGISKPLFTCYEHSDISLNTEKMVLASKRVDLIDFTTSIPQLHTYFLIFEFKKMWWIELIRFVPFIFIRMKLLWAVMVLRISLLSVWCRHRPYAGMVASPHKRAAEGRNIREGGVRY